MSKAILPRHSQLKFDEQRFSVNQPKTEHGFTNCADISTSCRLHWSSPGQCVAEESLSLPHRSHWYIIRRGIEEDQHNLVETLAQVCCVQCLADCCEALLSEQGIALWVGYKRFVITQKAVESFTHVCCFWLQQLYIE